MNYVKPAFKTCEPDLNTKLFKEKFMKYIFLLTFISLLISCTNSTIRRTTETYSLSQSNISIGDSINKVMNILNESQQNLGSKYKKPVKRYSKGNDIFEIFYARSGYIADNENTDDEFTPYIFKNNILTAIGWDYLGGTERTSSDIINEKYKIKEAYAAATRLEVSDEQMKLINDRIDEKIEHFVLRKLENMFFEQLIPQKIENLYVKNENLFNKILLKLDESEKDGNARSSNNDPEIKKDLKSIKLSLKKIAGNMNSEEDYKKIRKMLDNRFDKFESEIKKMLTKYKNDKGDK